jgi:CubicO group peptidase (beta-lactamase class C family)
MNTGSLRPLGLPSIVLVAMMGLTSGNALPSRDATLHDRLHPILKQAAQDLEVPGMVVAVICEGRIDYLEAFGVRDLAEPIAPVTPETLLQMASVTKTFSAAAVMQLVEQGKLDLDAPVAGYLSHFRLADPRYAQITARQLLSHSSGTPNVEDPEFDNPQYDDGALERFVRSIGPRALVASPGTEFHYSNIGYSVLGDLVAKVSGEVFEKYVDEHILKPLAMKRSTLLLEQARSRGLATPHIVSPAYEIIPSRLFPYNRTLSPAATLYSSGAEMSRWALVNLNRGTLDGVRILADSTYDLLWQAAGESFPHMGLGWFLWTYRGLRMVGHSGSDLGFVTDLQLMPEHGIAVVVMMNRDRGSIRPVVRAALDAALGLTPEIIVVKPWLARRIYRMIDSEGVASAMEKYRELKNQGSEEVDFNEWVLNDVGYNLLRQGRADEAVRVFTVNVEDYPESSNAHDSLADGYWSLGDRGQALYHYRKSLELNPNNRKAEERIREISEAP